MLKREGFVRMPTCREEQFSPAHSSLSAQPRDPLCNQLLPMVPALATSFPLPGSRFLLEGPCHHSRVFQKSPDNWLCPESVVDRHGSTWERAKQISIYILFPPRCALATRLPHTSSCTLAHTQTATHLCMPSRMHVLTHTQTRTQLCTH